MTTVESRDKETLPDSLVIFDSSAIKELVNCLRNPLTPKTDLQKKFHMLSLLVGQELAGTFPKTQTILKTPLGLVDYNFTDSRHTTLLDTFQDRRYSMCWAIKESLLDAQVVPLDSRVRVWFGEETRVMIPIPILNNNQPTLAAIDFAREKGAVQIDIVSLSLNPEVFCGISQKYQSRSGCGFSGLHFYTCDLENK